MMKRRKFIEKSAAGAALLSAPMSLFGDGMARYKIGLQLFTIRDAMEVDPAKTLEQVAELGYQDLETYGLEPDNLKYYGYKAKALKGILDDLGLTTSSGHYSFADYLFKPEAEMLKFVDRCIAGAKALEQDYITWPWLPPEGRDLKTFERLPVLLNKIGERVNQAGLNFAYHNHNFEFVDFGGKNGYDIVMDNTDPELVKLQLDMYWAEHSSPVSSVDLIAKAPERFVMWHIKDMDKVTRDYSELGNGSIDYHDILSRASQKGLRYYFLEQGGNFATNSMKSITDSLGYFKKELIQYLD